LDRREVLKLLALSSALPALPADVVGALRQVHGRLANTTLLKTLDPHMNATVTAMAVLIIPQTETPGAKAVRVNESIDVILSDRPIRDADLAPCYDYVEDFIGISEKSRATTSKTCSSPDGGCMTSSDCVNPSLTYMALTARACDHAI
jgi:hypothetical protein